MLYLSFESEQWIAFAKFAALYTAGAGFATLIGWRSPTRTIGFILALTCVITNGGILILTFPQRVVLEIMLATLISITTLDTWLTSHSRYAEPIICLSILDVCFSGAVCLYQSQAWRMVHLFDIATNAIYAAQCGFVAWPGIRNGLVAVRRRFVVRFARNHDVYSTCNVCSDTRTDHSRRT